LGLSSLPVYDSGQSGGPKQRFSSVAIYPAEFKRASQPVVLRKDTMSVENLQELLIDELKDLYSAEKQIIRALPKLAKAASTKSLATDPLGNLRRHWDSVKWLPF
jgi:hypothetical protein